MAKKSVIEAQEEVMAEPIVEKKKHDSSSDIVEINCFCPIIINGKEHFGKGAGHFDGGWLQFLRCCLKKLTDARNPYR